MALFAGNGEAFGEFILLVKIFVVFGIGYVLVSLPGWIGSLGGRLGLWKWSSEATPAGK